MKMIMEAIAEGSNFQNNSTSNVNTEGGHFLHFGTIEVNPFRGFEEGNNNPPLGNNNNNNLPPFLLPGFREGLGGGFNPPPEGNAEELNPNVAALVNALTGANLEVNYIERESNHVKSTEFRGIEIKDLNKWLE